MKAIQILVLFIFLLEYAVFPQNKLTEISKTEVNFGNGNSALEIYTHDNLMFVLTGRNYLADYSVGIFDITDVNNPVELGRQDGYNYQGNAKYEGYVAFIEDTSSPKISFYVVRTDPSSGIIDHYFWVYNSVVRIGNNIYTFSGYYNLEVKSFEITPMLKLRLISTMQTDTLQQGEISGIATSGNIIFVTTRKSGSNKGLLIVDVSDPGNMKEIKSPVQYLDFTGIAAGNGKLFIGKEFNSVLVYDCTDPNKLSYIKTVNYQHSRLRGFFKDNKYYLFGQQKDISFFDDNINLSGKITTAGNVLNAYPYSSGLIISSDAAIEFYNLQDTTGNTGKLYGANIAWAEDFTAQGNYIYTANIGDGLRIFDISDSSKPVFSGSLDINGSTKSVAVQGQYAYLADELKGLLISDITDPKAPVLISRLNIPGASDLDINGGRVYLIDNSGNLYVINIERKENPEIEFSTRIQNVYTQYSTSMCKIKAAADKIWIKFGQGPLYAFQYSGKSLTELLKYEFKYSGGPYELKSADSLLFLVHTNGLQIFNAYNLKALGNIPASLAGGLNSVSMDRAEKILYGLMIYDYGWGIRSYDIKDPESPKLLNEGGSPDFFPDHLLFKDGRLYVLGRQYMSIFYRDKTNNLPADGNAAGELSYRLSQNYPNPFNPGTTINYSIAKPSFVELKVFDLLGKEAATLVSKVQNAGAYKVEFNGSALAGGIYIYTIKAGEFRSAKKFLLLK